VFEVERTFSVNFGKGSKVAKASTFFAISKLKLVETGAYGPVYVAWLVIVVPFAVISFIVYCAPVAKLAVPVLTPTVKVTEVPLEIATDFTVAGFNKAAAFESMYAELIVTVAEPVF
jgi:hypothetical protein